MGGDCSPLTPHFVTFVWLEMIVIIIAKGKVVFSMNVKQGYSCNELKSNVFLAQTISDFLTLSTFHPNSLLQALAVKVLTISEDVEIRGMKHEVTMGNICSSNNNNKVVNIEMSR